MCVCVYMCVCVCMCVPPTPPRFSLVLEQGGGGGGGGGTGRILEETTEVLCATVKGSRVSKVLLSFWPLGARKRSYIRTRHSL